MNAPTPALVARPERLRLVGQRRQILAVMHQRLMLGMLVYAGIIAIIALRLIWLAAFGDHAGRKGGLVDLTPERGDIVDRDGQALARTIDAWTIGLQPSKVIGNKLDLAEKLAVLMPEKDAAAYLARFDENASAARAAITRATDEWMQKDFTVLKADGQVFFTSNRQALIRRVLLNHLIHHRGQLTQELTTTSRRRVRTRFTGEQAEHFSRALG